MAIQQKTNKKATRHISIWIISLMIALPVIYLIIWNYSGKKNSKLAKSDTATAITDTTKLVPDALSKAIVLANTEPTENNYINLSLQYYNNKMFTECIAANQKALAINPKSTIAYNNICSAYNELKNYKAAEKACNQALAISPGNTLATNNLNVAKTGILQNKKAIDAALVTAAEKTDEASYNNLAYLYYTDFQYANAITWYKKSLEINPKNAGTYNNICAAYNELGQYEEAKKYCEKAIELEPTFTLAKNNLKVSIENLKK